MPTSTEERIRFDASEIWVDLLRENAQDTQWHAALFNEISRLVNNHRDPENRMKAKWLFRWAMYGKDF